MNFSVYIHALICYSLKDAIYYAARRPGRQHGVDRKEQAMAKAERRERSMALYETILNLKDLDECCRFFDDLCTPTELRSMEQRFDVAVYLQQGLVYLDILDKTGASSATISRVRRSMLDNGAGGVMQEVISRNGLHLTDDKQDK